jgi:cytochrome P450
MGNADAVTRGASKRDFPVLDGALPVLGHLAEMYRRFPALCARGRAKHGPLFWIHGGPGARQLMYADPAALSLLKSPSVSTSFYAEGFGALLGNTLFSFDGDEHRRVRQAVTPPFTAGSASANRDVLEIITSAVDARIDKWERTPSFDVASEVGEIALEIIFRIHGRTGRAPRCLAYPIQTLPARGPAVDRQASEPAAVGRDPREGLARRPARRDGRRTPSHGRLQIPRR